jgi:dienelactone hydrolase
MRSMDTLLAPSRSILTTLLKPFYFLRVVSAAISFFMANRQSTIIPKLFAFHEAIRADPETRDLKVASAGFCWGGKYTIHVAQERDLVDAGFIAHPSNMAFPTDWDKVQKPLSMAIGDVDISIKVGMVKKIKILLEETKPYGQNEVVILPGAKHGFAIRADPNDKVQVQSAEEATAQALAWFDKWLVQGGEAIE